MADWTPELLEEASRLFATGDLSAEQIATRLGHGITRNAVIGKMRRRGIVSPRQNGWQTINREKRKARKAEVRIKPTVEKRTAQDRTTAPTYGRNKPAIYATAPRPIDKGAVVPATGILLIDHKDGQCRWGYGDPRTPEFRYCGQPTGDRGQSWCPVHHRVAFTGGKS